MPKKRTIEEINQKIQDGSVHVVTADEVPELVEELGVDQTFDEVDVVTSGTFGAMCSSGVWLNFGHSDPPIRAERISLNNVPCYGGLAAVDTYVGATQPSTDRGLSYGGGHVIEDLLKGKNVHLVAESSGTDCYPRRYLSNDLRLDDFTQAVMANPRNAYQRYNVATNSSPRTLHTYMGKLLPNWGNATFSGAGELSPLLNDPSYKTIGVGTKIFLGGGVGYVTGEGTQHNPEEGFGTLMVQGNLKGMTPEFVRGASFGGYGCSLYVGLGIPIPILDSSLVRSTAVRDQNITTKVIDYSVSSCDRPVLAEVTYEELFSGCIDVQGQEIPTSSLSSRFMAKKVASELKSLILNRQFGQLTLPVERLSQSSKPPSPNHPRRPSEVIHPSSPDNNGLWYYEDQCVHCGQCIAHCPFEVFSWAEEEDRVVVKAENCTQCLSCEGVCPTQALVVGS